MDEMDQKTQPKVTQELTPEERKTEKRRVYFSSFVKFVGKIFALCLTVLMIIVAVYCVINRDRMNLDAIRRTWAYYTATGETAASIELGLDSYTSCAAVEKDIIVCGEQGFWLYDRNGDMILEQQESFAQPVLSVVGKYALINDANGSALYVVYHEQILYSYTAADDYALLSARISDDGWLTIVEESSGYKASATVYNAGFTPVLTENISSAFVMDAVLSYDHNQLALVLIGEDSSGFDTEIVIYQLSDGAQVSQCSLGTDVVIDLNWAQEGLWVGSQYGVYFIVDGEIACSLVDSAQYLQSLSLTGDGFSLIAFSKYQSGSSAGVRLLMNDGETHSISVNGTVLSLCSAGNYFAILTESSLTVYQTDMTIIYSTENNSGAKSVLLRSDGSALLVSGNNIRLVTSD